MTEQQWRRAWDLYESASGLPVDDQLPFLDSFPTVDAEVRAEVRSMLDDSQRDTEPGAGDHSRGVGAAVLASQRPAPNAARSGDCFGRYVIRMRIGRGGMGEVYEAEDPDLGRNVALKFLPAGGIGHQDAIDRFMVEARALSALNHPNIVTVHEIIQRGDQIAIVMELVEGQPLRRMCGPMPLPLSQVTYIGEQIATALAAAHARGVVHGDIKPENVIVRPDGYAKVLDFGLARRAGQDEDSPKTGRIAGTFRYMAPEQIHEEASTPASDVYSLGLLLYELAAGHHPFGATTVFPALRGNMPKTPEPLAANHPEIPAALDELIVAMLRPDPATRTSAPEAAAKLGELRRASDPRSQRRDKTSISWRTVAGAAACLVLVLAGTYWWSARLGPDNAPPRTRPLTSQPGLETEPALSADGEWIAFLWASNGSRQPALYVQQLKADSPQSLDTKGLQPRAPTWSPDGQRIAFRARDAVYEIPRQGGVARKIASLIGECDGAGLDWSPNGKSLLLSECPAGKPAPVIFEIDTASGERVQITSPPEGSRGDFDPKYSPDGLQVAFRRARQPVVEDVYVQRLPSRGEPTPVTRDGRGVAGLAWTPDGASLLISSQRASGIYGLWRVYVNKPFVAEAVAQAGQHAKMPSIARKGSRAAWINQIIDHNIWTIPFDGSNAAGPATRIVASTQRDVDVHAAADGRIAFRSDRSGVSEIWIAQPEGGNPVRVTSMGGPLTGTPRWSPDGSYLAFDSRPGGNPDVYLLRCDGMKCEAAARRLTNDPSADVVPSWSEDGKSIYFSSNRSGRREIWRVSIEAGAQAEQITRNGGYLAIESRGGGSGSPWLYYSKIGDGHGLWRAPRLAGGGLGDEEHLADPFDDYGAASWILSGAGEILYLGGGKDTGILAMNIGTRATRRLHDMKDHPIERGLAYSRFRRSLLYSQLDRSDSNIVVEDGFR